MPEVNIWEPSLRHTSHRTSKSQLCIDKKNDMILLHDTLDARFKRFFLHKFGPREITRSRKISIGAKILRCAQLFSGTRPPSGEGLHEAFIYFLG